MNMLDVPLYQILYRLFCGRLTVLQTVLIPLELEQCQYILRLNLQKQQNIRKSSPTDLPPLPPSLPPSLSTPHQSLPSLSRNLNLLMQQWTPTVKLTKFLAQHFKQSLLFFIRQCRVWENRPLSTLLWQSTIVSTSQIILHSVPWLPPNLYYIIVRRNYWLL